MNRNQLTDQQLSDAPSDLELAEEDELRARQERSRPPRDEFSPSNQDPWITITD